MRTLIFDIDGTLTDMSPIEQVVLGAMAAVRRPGMSKRELRSLYADIFVRLARAGKLPEPVAYRTVDFIKRHAAGYQFVYATGAQSVEAEFVLDSLGIMGLFDARESINVDNCRFSKLSGIPLRRLKRLFPDSLLITDGANDMVGAQKAGLSALLVKPNDVLTITDVCRAGNWQSTTIVG